ncbi:phage major capsid protein [Leucobacter ruminantium]|uniref:Phage major capsid protein n=1 Tax=Leucobacter ruminantium TaxID=1289170 RepID=A0A939LZV2_9MICO|nr:phage major capsid protein [Leucobacter ruminantium]MBO1805963.1 phage major capsid protein [Leucobacter ruminantium]
MAATQTTLNSSKAWAPDKNIFNPADAVPDALILQHSTIGGVIEGDAPALRVAYVTDDTAQFTAEGAEIPEADPGLDEVLVYTAKVTQLVRISNEQYRQDGTAGELSQSVQRAIMKKADQAFLTQTAPVSPAVAPPAGILNISGIENGGAVDGNLDALVDLLAQLESNGGTPTGIILDPLAWASLRKFKTATGSELTILGAGTNDAQKMLLDLPVTVSNALTANSGLVVDQSAVASAVGPVNVATDESAYFTTDGVALRATWRIGWNLVRPNRVGKFTVTAPTVDED